MRAGERKEIKVYFSQLAQFLQVTLRRDAREAKANCLPHGPQGISVNIH